MVNINNNLFVVTIIKGIVWLIIMGIIIMVPAGTIKFINAWILLIINGITTIGGTIYFKSKDVNILKRRTRFIENELVQKIYVVVTGSIFFSMYVISGLDYRLQLTKFHYGLFL